MNAWSNILPFPATSASFLWLIAVMQVLVIAALLVASYPIRYRGLVADRITR